MEAMRMGSVAGLGIPHATVCDTTVGEYILIKFLKLGLNDLNNIQIHQR